MIYIQAQKDIMLNKALNSIKGKGFSLRKVFPLIIAFLLILSLYFIPVYVVTARDYENNKMLKMWLPRDDYFEVFYTHSVELSEVREIYQIDTKGENIILKETLFSSYGAGLPATTKYDFEKTDDGFRIYNINEEFKEVVYRTGAVRANHKLFINNEEYEFLDFSKPMQAIKFSVEKISFIRYLTGRVG